MDLSLGSIADLLFVRTRTGYLAITAFLFLIVLLRSRSPLLRRISAAVMWISAFSLYDVFGYDFLVMTDSTATATLGKLPELQPAYAAALNAYRILQVTFQIVLTTMVLYAAGRRAAGAAMLAWWGGACDLLYYALTMRALPESWDWMWFTPVGLFIDVLPLWLVIAQAGVLATIAGLLLFTEAHHFHMARRFREKVTSLRRSPQSPR